ncbi:P-selectin-like [Branchiostoma floridae x Branchiostoma japonicum]
MKFALGIVGALMVANFSLAVTCPYPVDLVFLMDSSESYRTSGFEDAKTFVQKVVNYFTLGENDTRVGVVTYSNQDAQVTRVKLNENYTRVELLTEIRNIVYDRGHTFTGLGLDYVRNNSFLEVNGRRNNTLDFLIVITDDESEDGIVRPAQLIRQMGITVFVVGVGEESDISQPTLETIAGNPSRVFRLSDHDFLVDDEHPRFIRESICNASNLCDPSPCHTNATCQLLGRTYTCTCNVGFVGNGFTCTVVQCPVLTAPANGALAPTNRRQYQDQVTFTCNTGYNLAGQTMLTCLVTGSWSASPPTCNPIQCPAQTAPTNGAISPTAGPYNYQVTVSYTCNNGYVRNGATGATCQADGTWSNPVHTCTPIQCPVLSAPANGVRSPTTGSNFYTNTIAFTCNAGYQLTGTSPLTCQADGTWSNTVPTCTRIQCPVLSAPTNGIRTPATGANLYQDTITFTCNNGYVRVGDFDTRCQANGQWSNPVPTCTPRQCPALTPPANGALSSAGPYFNPNQVTVTCNSGYQRNGVSPVTCQADGTWSNPVPTCTPYGALNPPAGPYVYQNQVTVSCNSGYQLNGVSPLTCHADGTWSNNVPTCERSQCPDLTAPTNGARTPSTGGNFYQGTITFTCNSGYVRNGAETSTCQADGTWSNPVPTCTPRPCPRLVAPTNGALSPAGPYAYPNQVTVTCNSGYDLDGVSPVTCLADGTWSNPVGTCRGRCPVLTAPTNGARTPPTGSNSFYHTVTFTCNSGYQLNGATTATCQTDGTWTNAVPTCTPRQCNALAAPANGVLSPAEPHSYPVTVTFTCNTGYVRNGAQTTTCQTDGSWSNPTPTCIPRPCSALTAPTNGALRPPGPYSYQNQVTVTCNSGYQLNGVSPVTCQAAGTWSNTVPTCTRKTCLTDIQVLNV